MFREPQTHALKLNSLLLRQFQSNDRFCINFWKRGVDETMRASESWVWRIFPFKDLKNARITLSLYEYKEREPYNTPTEF